MKHTEHEMLPIDHFAAQHTALHPVEVSIVERIVRDGCAVRMCRCGLLIAADIYTQLPAAFAAHMVKVSP